MKKLICLLLVTLTMSGCGPGFQVADVPTPPIGTPDPYDGAVVIGRAYITIQNGQVVAFNRKKPFNIADLLIPRAFAYTGAAPSATVNITYTNAAQSNYVLNSSAISTSPTFSGDGLTLGFGNIALSGLDDNKLKVCGAVGTQGGAGTTQCNTAQIRVYATTGDADGVFCNSADGYCVPMKANNSTFGVGAANAAVVLTHNIPANVNRLRMSQLASTSWPLDVDMSNAGAGSYSATIVVEYLLRRN